jgi:hypothetical protein
VNFEPDPARPVRAKRATTPTEVTSVIPAPQPSSSPQPPPVEVSSTPEPVAVHKLVERTQAKVAAATPGELTHVSGRGRFTVCATPLQADRIAQVLSLLVRAAEGRGWVVKADDHGVKFEPDDEPISLQLTERTDRVRHVQTEKEAEAVRKHEEKRKIALRKNQWFSDWDAPKIPEWDYVPNGKLVLTFNDMQWKSSTRRTFSDTKYRGIELMVDLMVQSLATYAADMKQRRIEAERCRLEGIEAEKRWREAQRRRELEAKRVEFLDRQIQRQQRIAQVEAFIASMANQESQGGDVADFIAWARDFSAQLRQDLSHETLSVKLEKLDLMNASASIPSWTTVD